jgi:tRNA (mo5U34)-methyltransferase
MSPELKLGPLTVKVSRGRGGTELRDENPLPTPLRRDPERALDFLRGPELAGDGVHRSEKLAAELAAADQRYAAASSLAEKVAAVSWYHTIELPENVVTPGSHDHRGLVDRIGFPADLSGHRCLDVATFDGFWAFEMERRGASDVVAVDLPSAGGLDLPRPAKEILINEGLDVPFGRGFQLAAEALGSRVERRAMSVYDLSPKEVGKFDLVHSGDLLLHLAAPWLALAAMRSVTRGAAIIVDRFDPLATGLTLVYRGGWRGLEWWAPSLATLVQWVVDAGFFDVEVRGTYELGNCFSGGVAWSRAVIHARA